MDGMIGVRNLDKKLWHEMKAQAKLQNLTISDWLNDAIKASLLSAVVLRQRAPEEAECEICGRAIYKNKKPRMIFHHNEQNTRDASVVMILCDQCHKDHHRKLGWGTPYSKEVRKPGKTKGSFKCYLCKKSLPPDSFGGFETLPRRQKILGKGLTKAVKVKVCKHCWMDKIGMLPGIVNR